MKTVITVIMVCIAVASGIKHFNSTTVAMTQHNHQLEVAIASLDEIK
jgi:hypothetical protein